MMMIRFSSLCLLEAYNSFSSITTTLLSVCLLLSTYTKPYNATKDERGDDVVVCSGVLFMHEVYLDNVKSYIKSRHVYMESSGEETRILCNLLLFLLLSL